MQCRNSRQNSSIISWILSEDTVLSSSFLRNIIFEIVANIEIALESHYVQCQIYSRKAYEKYTIFLPFVTCDIIVSVSATYVGQDTDIRLPENLNHFTDRTGLWVWVSGIFQDLIDQH